MGTLRRVLLAFALAAIVAAAAAQPAAAQDVTASCDPTCSSWRTSNFHISWAEFPAVGVPGSRIVSGCVDGPITTETKGTALWCAIEEVDATGAPIGSAQESRVVRLDKTPPLVSGASPSRAPDHNGWYRLPVGMTFVGTDATSGVQSCTSTTYSAPDAASAPVSGTCTDIAGNVSAASTVSLKYDSTGPDITRGRPVRKPDHGRWYNQPVRWRFKGKDALSGVAECPPVLYRGPDGALARVIGGCRDNAGNIALRSFVLRYDATPPPRPTVRALPRDGAVRLKIDAPQARSIVILRAPGRRGTEDSTLYRGRPRSFTDFRAVNGRHYEYTVVSRDRAANRSRRTVDATPGPRLLQPADGAVLGAPPLLRWTPVHGASYYNVQLRRDGRKVLSRWPARPRLQLPPAWTFRRAAQQLVPGRYEWDVWPGFGERRAARYGSRIGSRVFVIPAALPAR